MTEAAGQTRLALAHVYGEPRNAIAISDKRLTNIEVEPTKASASGFTVRSLCPGA
jgi:hypothetical protein